MKSLAVAKGFSYFGVSVVRNLASGNSKIINSQMRPIMEALIDSPAMDTS